MSQRNRVARVSGMNNNVVGQLPERGSFYSASGAPGLTAGPVSGFSVAFGIRIAAKIATPTDGTPWIDPTAEEGGSPTPGSTVPDIEYIAGTANLNDGSGWALLVEANGQLVFAVGDGFMVVDLVQQRGEYIGLMSYVPDGTPYDGGAGARTTLALNGLLFEVANDINFGYSPSGSDFSIGGTTDPDFISDPIDNGGCVYNEITSLWITDGIPTIDEANAFFESSMDAGIVIPQAWAPARTVAEPNPATPANPTGNYWTAGGVDPNGTLGSPWLDKLGNADLTRVSPPAPGAPPVEGDIVVSSRQPQFPYIPGP